jgi:hypothetical protein
MKCVDCKCCKKGWFESKPNDYVCIGVKEPFVISNVNSECTEYSEKRNDCVKHKYIRELFPEYLPFPYDEEDYSGFDNRDTFNLDSMLLMWLYERLRFFQDEASKIVVMDNPEWKTFNIDGEKLTQMQCINRMVEDCKVALLSDDFDEYEKMDMAMRDLFKVLAEVYWAMWW